MKGIVFDIKEFAVFDGPGIRTTVFMKGCPLRCQWCHNPEGISPKPELMVSRSACVHCGTCEAVCPHKEKCTACGACIQVCRGGFRRIAGREWDSDALAARLLKDRDVYDSSGGGVTFSGGEPLLQWPFVREVIGRLGGLHTAVETSGYASDEIFSDMMNTCSLILMDWKLSDPEKHLHYTGVSQEIIRRHAEMLCRGSTPFILRMPVIPGVNDNPDHFRTVAMRVKDAPALVRIDVLPYQQTAGAKYEMVGRHYEPEFNEVQPINLYTEVFDIEKIPYQVF